MPKTLQEDFRNTAEAVPQECQKNRGKTLPRERFGKRFVPSGVNPMGERQQGTKAKALFRRVSQYGVDPRSCVGTGIFSPINHLLRKTIGQASYFNKFFQIEIVDPNNLKTQDPVGSIYIHVHHDFPLSQVPSRSNLPLSEADVRRARLGINNDGRGKVWLDVEYVSSAHFSAQKAVTM
jgi:hypothetical protein